MLFKDSTAARRLCAVAVLLAAPFVSPSAYAICLPPVVTAMTPTGGPTAGGTTVTITGSNFYSGHMAVSFGGASATAVTTNRSSLTAVSPPGSGTVTVTVQNGCRENISIVAGQFTYATPDSPKLKSMQQSTMPIGALVGGQAISGAIDQAIETGFAGAASPFTPNGSGFTYYFGVTPAVSDEDSVRHFVASPTAAAPQGDAALSALGYAGPVKAPPLRAPASDWLAWVDVRGAQFDRNTTGSDLSGSQLDALAGISRRVTADLVVGGVAGYEHFAYFSQALSGSLRSDGWVGGVYAGWRFAPNLRLDGALAYTGLTANDSAGTATGDFTGGRLLASGGVTGTYGLGGYVVEPSARVFALWERDNGFTDSLGNAQSANTFSTGRASLGGKVSRPFDCATGTTLSPYAGIYGDYHFSSEGTASGAFAPAVLLQGWGARFTGGVEATFTGGFKLGAGGEFEDIAGNTQIWSWRARGSVPF